jgi:hypothetical protein
MMKKYILFFCLLSFPGLLCAGEDEGGWIGSGGELFRDAHNPWFLKNVSKVTYCVRVDSSSISAERGTILKIIEESFKFWQKEFGKQISILPEDGHYNLGSQEFELEDCQSSTDIRFLFGYGSLSAKEINFLKKPKRYIGITVRTDYDQVELRGKGFIYISSDKGENAYDNTGHLIQEAWQHKKLIQYALIHELGHMYGIPHTGKGVMAEVFLDQLLNKNIVENFIKLPLESFLHPHDILEVCLGVTRVGRSFFGVEGHDQCLVMKLKQVSPFSQVWEVFSKEKEESVELKYLGKIANIRPELFDFRGRPASILQITEKQKVFTPKETAFRPFMVGPMILDTGAKGVYLKKSGGIPQSLYLRMTNSTVTILASSKNKVIPVFIYNSPLGLLMLISPNL